jgi:hypothetical protein
MIRELLVIPPREVIRLEASPFLNPALARGKGVDVKRDYNLNLWRGIDYFQLTNTSHEITKILEFKRLYSHYGKEAS